MNFMIKYFGNKEQQESEFKKYIERNKLEEIFNIIKMILSAIESNQYFQNDFKCCLIKQDTSKKLLVYQFNNISADYEIKDFNKCFEDSIDKKNLIFFSNRDISNLLKDKPLNEHIEILKGNNITKELFNYENEKKTLEFLLNEKHYHINNDSIKKLEDILKIISRLFSKDSFYLSPLRCILYPFYYYSMTNDFTINDNCVTKIIDQIQSTLSDQNVQK